MKKLIDGIKYDAAFVRSHTLQPGWYKILKVFLILGFLAGYAAVFGWWKMGVFLFVFLLLALVIHVTYRVKTIRFTQSWLDFVVIQDGPERRFQRIGKFYYGTILINAIIAIAISLMAAY